MVPGVGGGGGVLSTMAQCDGEVKMAAEQSETRALSVTYADGQTESWPFSEDSPLVLEAWTAAEERKSCDPTHAQKPSFLFPSLRAKPWWDASKDAPEFVRALQAAHDDLVEEATRLLACDGWAGQEEGLHAGEWEQFTLYSGGTRTSASRRAPVAMRLLESLAADAVSRPRIMLEAPGRAYYSKILSNTHVRPHCGPTNHRLRLHWALVIPPASAETLHIRVANETRTWLVGTALLFDDSFEHEVRFLGSTCENGTRVVFVLDLWHPDMSLAG